MEKLDVLIVGCTPAAFRAERKAMQLGLKTRRLDSANGVLPAAVFRVDATEDASFAKKLRVFTRDDYELKSETGEPNAPDEPISARTPRRVMGDIILTESDLDAHVPFPDATPAAGIPLRSLYSCWSGNLFLAGTVISATAQAQKRLMAMPGVLERTGDMVACAIAVGCRRGLTYHRIIYSRHFDEFLDLVRR